MRSKLALIEAKATEAYVKLRATASAQVIRAETAAEQIAADVKASVLAASIKASVIQADLAASVLKATAVLGEFVKLLSFYDGASVEDDVAIVVGRQVNDLADAVDIISVSASKALTESSAATDAHVFALNRAVAELVAAADAITFKQFSKNLVDPADASDVSLLAMAKGFSESKFVGEGPFISTPDEYSPNYFAEDYVGEGRPIWTLGKTFQEFAAPADAAYSEVGKTLTDGLASGDSAFMSVQLQLADYVVATDAAFVQGTGTDWTQSASDVPTVTDAIAASTNKLLTESAQASDSGSYRMTDYCDITYFAEDYVGSSSTF